jgi:hypothetical protein
MKKAGGLSKFKRAAKRGTELSFAGAAGALAKDKSHDSGILTHPALRKPGPRAERAGAFTPRPPLLPRARRRRMLRVLRVCAFLGLTCLWAGCTGYQQRRKLTDSEIVRRSLEQEAEPTFPVANTPGFPTDDMLWGAATIGDCATVERSAAEQRTRRL